MKARNGDVVTLRHTEDRYVVEEFPAADEFCVPVMQITDTQTGTDRRLVLPEDIHAVERAA